MKVLSKNRIDFLVVAASTVLSSLISFAFVIIARRYIPPLEYGIYSTCLLLSTYASYAQLGVLNAFNRDFPQTIGAKDHEKALRLKNTTLTYFSGVYALIGVITIVVVTCMYLRGILDARYYLGYIFVVVTILVEQTAAFSMNVVRMSGDFYYTSFVTVISSTAAAVAGYFMILKFGYYGIYSRAIFCGLVSIALYYKRSLSDIHLRIDTGILRESITTGFPMLVSNLVWTVVGSIDKFVILGFISTVALGVYSVAQTGFSMVVMIPQAMAQVFYIKMSTAYGESKDKYKLISQCGDYSIINIVCASCISLLVYYMFPIFVQIVMPKYTDGIRATQILLIGVAVYSSSILYDSVYSVLRWNKELIRDTILLCIFNATCSVGLVLIFGNTIENVAWGTSISYMMFALIKFARISRQGGVSMLSIVAKCWIPVGAVLIPGIIIYHVADNIYIGFSFAIVIILATLGIMYKKGKLLNE